MGDHIPRLSMLGPVEVSVATEPVRIGGPIARLLLVQLALARGRTVPDERAIDAVWGHRPPDSVAAALRVHSTSLRASLRTVGWTLHREHAGYALRAAALCLDTDDLDAAEHVASDDADLPAALSAVDLALDLWRGPSLVDVRRLPLGERLAEGLDRRRRALVDRRLHLLVELGRAREALGTLEGLVHEDPLEEARWALLATALYHCGHPAQALRALEEARRVLADEAGLLPGPVLRELQQRILTHSMHAAPRPEVTRSVPSGIPAALAALQPPRLHGRHTEMASLRAAVERADSSGRSVVVRLSGQSGSGKSALLARLASDAVGRGFDVRFGWAEEQATPPLGLLANPLDELTAQVPELRNSHVRQVLDAVLGRSLAGATEPMPATAVIDRAQMLDAVRRTFAMLRRPLLLVLDDVQWADEVSLAAVRSIGRFPVDRPLVIVVSEREARLPVASGRGIEEITVGPLNTAAVQAWTRITDQRETSQLMALTGGLPMLVEEVLRQLSAGAQLSQLREAMSRRLLRERSSRLPDRAIDVLLAGAVLGHSFTFADLTAALAVDDLQLVEDLDEAVAAGILSYDLDEAGTFRFVHDLLRQAVLDHVTPLRVMRLHASVLDTISALPPQRAVEHAWAAGRFVDPARLSELTLAAAAHQLEGFGFHSARRLVHRVLDEHRAQLGDVAVARLLTLLAQAEAALGEARAAREHLHQAVSLAQSTGDVETAAQAVLLVETLFGHGLAMAADTPAMLQRLLDALPADAWETQSTVLRQLVFAHISAGRLGAAEQALGRARLVAGGLGGVENESALVYLDHFLAECSGEQQRRRAAVLRAGELAEENDSPRLRTRHLGVAVMEYLHAGAPGEADRCADELATLGAATGNPYARWLGLAAKFSAPFLAGDLTQASTIAETAHQQGVERDLFAADSAYLGQLFAVGWVRGQLPPVARPAEGSGLEGPELAWRAVAALTAALHGATEEAKSALSELTAVMTTAGAQWIGFVGLALAVEAAVLIDEPALLHCAESTLRRRLGDHVLLGTGILDLGPVSRYLALVCAGTGRTDAAKALLIGVLNDSASGAIWQWRAGFDLITLRGSVPARGPYATAAGPGDAWSWMRPTPAVGLP